MTDNWDKIAELLRDTPPPPAREEAKNDAISKAMLAFDEKNAQTPKGTGLLDRLMNTVRTVSDTFSGDDFMKKGYIIAGGVCAAMLTITLLDTSYLSDLNPAPPAVEQVQDAAPPQENRKARRVRHAEITASREQNAPKARGEFKRTAKPMKNEAVPADEAVAAAAPPPAAAPMVMDMAQAPQQFSSGGAVAGNAAPAMKAKREMLGGGVAASRMMAPGMVMPEPMPYYQPQPQGRDQFEEKDNNGVKQVVQEPVSTFSIDVDTASYAFVRSALNNGQLPPKDAVRLEEMVNYFPYDYAAPQSKDTPFKANVSVFPTPWNKDTRLLHIGIKGYALQQTEKPHANLVFLIDTSGSMNQPNKLPLLKNSLKLLLDTLKPDDSVAIVTYAGSAGVALEPTQAKDKGKILSVLENLHSGGSTAGEAGIREAYRLAQANYRKEGVNRVILATDGDFNIGISNRKELKNLIEEKRNSGISLSVLGFGRGNYNDALMQALAQNGNGNAAYIDNLSEARKTLVEEAGSTLFTIASDVKIQVEFNPAQIAEYRLLGYETRMLAREDFNNDKVDAGDIGAGHSVTAIYEITPVGSKAKLLDDLRYQKQEANPAANAGGEYAFVKIRYKLPGKNESTLITTPVDEKAEYQTLEAAPQEARFATAVAAFAQKLRADTHVNMSYGQLVSLAQSARGQDEFGYRAEFINLLRLAAAMSNGTGEKE